VRLVLCETVYRQSMLDLLKLSIGEARTIKRHTGMTIADWRLKFALLSQEDPDVFAALAYLFRSRAGETVTTDWSDINKLPAQDIISGLQFSNDDRELMARFLPPEVNWLDLLPADERIEEIENSAKGEPSTTAPEGPATETVELPE